jgi:hypothetical protein
MGRNTKRLQTTSHTPRLDHTTNRPSTDNILAIRRDTYKDATHLRDYITAAILTPHDGSPVIAISAYIPQLHTTEQEAVYKVLLTRIKHDITSTHPAKTILMGGSLQATPLEGDTRSHYAPLRQFCEESGLTRITLIDIYTFISSKTHIGYWILIQTNKCEHYTKHNIITTTHTPEHGDHKALILELP